MTRRPETDPHQRLVRHQHMLTHALDGVLDVEAGLREILIHSHHDTAVDDLGAVLDTEAGLAVILPPPRPPAHPAHHTFPPAQRHSCAR